MGFRLATVEIHDLKGRIEVLSLSFSLASNERRWLLAAMLMDTNSIVPSPTRKGERERERERESHLCCFRLCRRVCYFFVETCPLPQDKKFLRLFECRRRRPRCYHHSFIITQLLAMPSSPHPFHCDWQMCLGMARGMLSFLKRTLSTLSRSEGSTFLTAHGMKF